MVLRSGRAVWQQCATANPNGERRAEQPAKGGHNLPQACARRSHLGIRPSANTVTHIMVTPKNTPLEGTIPATAAALRALGNDGILDRLTLRAQTRASGTLEDGKMLAILDENRKGGTLKGVVKKHMKAKGFDDDTIADFADGLGHSYKCAIVFGVYCLGGLLPELDYDAGKVTWYVPVAAIENFWDKEKVPAEARSETRQRIVAILKSREAGTEKALTGIKKSIMEKDDDDAGDGNENARGGAQEEPELAPMPDARIAELTAKVAELEAIIAKHGDEMAVQNAALAEKDASITSLMAQVGDKDKLANKLALAYGELLNSASEEQLGMVPAHLAGLPDVIGELLQGIYAQRAEALAPEQAAELHVTDREQVAA